MPIATFAASATAVAPPHAAEGTQQRVPAHREARPLCFHCGEANVGQAQWTAVIDGTEREFCCGGCLAIAQTIRAAGLDQFYRRRSAPAESPPAVPDQAIVRDAAAAEAAGLVTRRDDGLYEAALLLEGIRCAACAWLIESYLQRQPGVRTATVNFALRRAHVCWDPDEAALATLLHAVAGIGYRGYPYDLARRELLARRESRALLLRAGIALLAMMQVMMFATPAYVSHDGVEPEFARLLSWASLALCLPVMAYSATPFFRGAWRDLRNGRAGMDVPVAIGIGAAFVASAWATLSGVGATYYDSVTMFVALLLVARLIELRARQAAADAIEATAREIPGTADRLRDYPAGAASETVAAASLRAGDHVCVGAGAAVPADGIVVEGRSSVEEALLTGESWPRVKIEGDGVFAGSINRDSPLIVCVTAAGDGTTLAALARLVERAANARPRVARLADRVAVRFVVALLFVAAAAGVAWLYVDPARALAVTLAVLVVSCPCALSLATPAALAAAAAALGRKQILAVRADALETLSRVDHIVFDKTGTLTSGHVRLIDVTVLGSRSSADCLALAAALERGSPHGIAAALRERGDGSVVARDIIAVPGCGVEGVIAGRRYRCGSPAWAGAMGRQSPPARPTAVAADHTAVALADDDGWLAWLSFGDSLRADAALLVTRLRKMGLRVSLLSGDRTATVQCVAAAVGIDDFHGDVSPGGKRDFIAKLQQQGAIVAMVGDGINDAPSLAQANVSLSFGSAATLTQWTADIVALGSDLSRIGDAFAGSRRAFGVIRQNLIWALLYNAVAIPLAATGQLTPLAAAIGMSMSSLLVVINALRLLRRPRPGRRKTPPDPVAAAGLGIA